MEPRLSYSQKVGRPAPSPWPVFEPIKNADNIRWQRTVVRLPDDVQAELHGRTLLLTGKAGSLKMDLEKFDPTGLLAFRLVELPSGGASHKSLLLLASPEKECFGKFCAMLESYLRGVSQGYLVGLTVKGVGYRMEPVEEAVTKTRWFTENSREGTEKVAVNYPYTKPAQAIRLKVGFSNTVVYPLPQHVKAFFVKPTMVYLYGLNVIELRRIALDIRSIRKPNRYTGNGIQLLDEKVVVKQRSSSKRA